LNFDPLINEPCGLDFNSFEVFFSCRVEPSTLVEENISARGDKLAFEPLLEVYHACFRGVLGRYRIVELVPVPILLVETVCLVVSETQAAVVVHSSIQVIEGIRLLEAPFRQILLKVEAADGELHQVIVLLSSLEPLDADRHDRRGR